MEVRNDQENEQSRMLIQMMRMMSDWELEHFPVPATHVGREMFFHLALNHFGKEHRTLKDIYWDTTHATSGLRKILAQLEQDGWLKRERLLGDKRCRRLVPTHEFLSLAEQYVQMLRDRVEEMGRKLLPKTGTDWGIQPGGATEGAPWKLLIVDDEQEVHEVTRLVLSDFVFEGRGLVFVHAYSGGEAMRLLEVHPDIAVALIDVVMESEDAGLRLVRHIRDVLGNACVRLILRTGHPGIAPERRVILDYDINDYKAKTELSSQKLFSMMVSALRGYRDILALNYARRGMERLLEIATNLFQVRSIAQFSDLALEQVFRLMETDRFAVENGSCGGLFVAWESFAAPRGCVLAATNKYDALYGTVLGESEPGLARFLEEQQTLTVKGSAIGLSLGSSFGERYSLYADLGRALSPIELSLLELFCVKANAVLENLFLAERNRAAQRYAIRSLATLAETADGSVTSEQLGRIESYAISLAEAVVEKHLYPQQRRGNFVDFVGAVSELENISNTSRGETKGGISARGGRLAERIVAVASLFETVVSASPFDEPWGVEQAISRLESVSDVPIDTPLVAALMHSISPGCDPLDVPSIENMGRTVR